MLPIISQPKDRPKKQAAKKIQDTNDMAAKKDTGEILKEDSLMHKKKVRWSDLEQARGTKIEAM